MEKISTPTTERIMGLSRFINIITQFFNNLSLRKQLLFAFILTSLVPLLLLSLFFYNFSKDIIIKEASERLQNIAERQTSQIRSYFDEQERFVTGLALLPFMATEIEKFEAIFKKGGTGTLEYEKQYQEFISFLDSYQCCMRFENLMLISAQGNILFSMKKDKNLGSDLKTGLLKNSDLAKVFDNAATLLEFQSSHFNFFAPANGPAAFFGSPVIDKEKKIIAGVVVLQLNNADIYRVVNEYKGLGETGETIILSQSGHDYTMMTPTRHDPLAGFRQTFDITSPDQTLLKKIAAGDQATEITTDYRGKKTLSYGKYFLPSLGWSIIVKMDTDELFKPINLLKWLFLLGLLSIAGLILAAIFAFTKSIHQPIQMLTDYARMIANGDFSVRMPVRSSNEIGMLSAEFNRMTDNIEHVVQTLQNQVNNHTNHTKGKADTLAESQEKLKSMQNRMIAQSKLASLGGLTAGIAHEIKNPLNFINNFSILTLELIPFFEDLSAKIKPTLSSEETVEINENISTLKDNLAMIHEQGNRANNIVQRMLSHSRGQEVNAKPYNIHQLLKEAIDLAYHGFRVQNPAFNTTIHKDFQAEDLDLTILGEDISRVFINLINNACYAVNQKSLVQIPDYAPTIWVKTKIDGNNFIITIRDNGVGIPEKVQKNLFSPFFTTKPSNEGTGLGLSLSHTIIVTEHKGTITCESVEGQFTEFTIKLPLESSLSNQLPPPETNSNQKGE